MQDLKAVRQGWEEAEAIELRLLRSMTAQESFLHWLLLQRLFEPQLQETGALFGPNRQSALAELQTRLRRLAEWQGKHGEPGSLRPETPTAAASS